MGSAGQSRVEKESGESTRGPHGMGPLRSEILERTNLKGRRTAARGQKKKGAKNRWGKGGTKKGARIARRDQGQKENQKRKDLECRKSDQDQTREERHAEPEANARRRKTPSGGDGFSRKKTRGEGVSTEEDKVW